MKKADNFDAKQWLVENKITFQSRLNEETEKGTYEILKENDIFYLKLYRGPDFEILKSKDGENFFLTNEFSIGVDKDEMKRRLSPIVDLLNSLPSSQEDIKYNVKDPSNPQPINNRNIFTLKVNLEDIKDNFSLKEKKKKTMSKIKSQYVVKDKEESDGNNDFYVINKNKALKYLKQFNNEDVDAETFINDDEGWGEFEQYLEDIEKMSDKQLEKAMREEMSYYFFSEPDGI